MDDLTIREIVVAIQERPAVPLWPHAGRALNLGRTATFDAADAGRIPVIDDVSRKRIVPTSWLRKKLRMQPAGG
jgi:hypothetical protein